MDTTTTKLAGHVSEQTAYLVDDYPYGFRLRCQIRYWLEWKPGKGFRLVSQTSNPKRAGLVWNKPKASTYALMGGCLILDEKGHVNWTQLTGYENLAECLAWRSAYASSMPQEAQNELFFFLVKKLAYERAKGRWQGDCDELEQIDAMQATLKATLPQPTEAMLSVEAGQ